MAPTIWAYAATATLRVRPRARAVDLRGPIRHRGALGNLDSRPPSTLGSPPHRRAGIIGTSLGTVVGAAVRMKTAPPPRRSTTGPRGHALSPDRVRTEPGTNQRLATTIPTTTRSDKEILCVKAKIIGASTAALAIFVGLMAAPAGAHVEFEPESVPRGSLAVLDLVVPNESDSASTVSLVLAVSFQARDPRRGPFNDSRVGRSPSRSDPSTTES